MTDDNIYKRGRSEAVSDKSNEEVGGLVSECLYHVIIEEEGVGDGIIQSPTVTASQKFNKNDADQNWIDKTGPHYQKGMLVLQ